MTNFLLKSIVMENFSDSYRLFDHKKFSAVEKCIAGDVFDQLSDNLHITHSFPYWEMSGTFSRTSDFFTKRQELQVYDRIDPVFLNKFKKNSLGQDLMLPIQSILADARNQLQWLLSLDQDDIILRFRLRKYSLDSNKNAIIVDPHIDTSLVNIFYYDSDKALRVHDSCSGDYSNVSIDFEKQWLMIFWADIQNYNPDLWPTLHSVCSYQDGRVLVNVSVLDKKWYEWYLDRALDIYSK